MRTGKVSENRYSQQAIEKPDILLIGDEYSKSYFTNTKQLLKWVANVEFLTYKGSSGNLLEELENKGADYFKKYEMVYFVAGWGDMQKVGDNAQISLQDFQSNLKNILALLRQNPVKIYWGTVLPLPKEQQSHINLVDEYNASSKKIMTDDGVYIIDIGFFARKQLQDYINGKTLEFNDEVIDLISRQVNAAIQFFGE